MRAKQFLIEYDRAKTLANYREEIEGRLSTHDFDYISERIHAHYNFTGDEADLHRDPVDWALQYIEEADPSRSKKFVLNILDWYLDSQFRYIEDVSRAWPPLLTYIKFKNRIKDINLKTIAFEDFEMRMEVIDGEGSSAEQSKAEEQAFFDSGAAEIIVDHESYKIIVPHTQEAACFFGRGTRWCTAAKRDNQFEYYNAHGLLYIVVFRGEAKKWQFHFEDHQFMDARDYSLQPEQIAETPLREWFDNKCREYLHYPYENRGSNWQMGKLVTWLSDPNESDWAAAVAKNPAVIWEGDRRCEPKLADKPYRNKIVRLAAQSPGNMNALVLATDLTEDDVADMFANYNRMSPYFTDSRYVDRVLENASPRLQLRIIRSNEAFAKYIPRPCQAICMYVLSKHGVWGIIKNFKVIPKNFQTMLLAAHAKKPHFDAFEHGAQIDDIMRIKTY